MSVEVSIVIAAHNARPALVQSLPALLAQEGIEAAEIIVADSSTDGTAQWVTDYFPSICLLHHDEPLTVPELRGRAIAAAQGEIIAILDPFSVVAQGWLAALRQAHRNRPNGVIGGTVDLHHSDSANWLDWALYINEYGMFMPPMPAGEMEILPGSNISYKRPLLFDEANQPRYPVFWKTFTNQAAEAAGSALWLAPEMQVSLYKPVPFVDFWRTRYHHGRCFAGMRVADAPSRERLWRAATAPLLPFLLLWRWGQRYLRKGHHRDKFLLTLPLQWLLFGTWALGELAGYLRGTGDSCRELFY